MSVGITEGYDPSCTYQWANSSCDMNIIITKDLVEQMIPPLMAMKDRTILHVTCTGLGKQYEPGAPDVEETINRILTITEKGFPAKQIVIRIDPIIPVADGLEGVRKDCLFSKKTQRTRCDCSL